MLNDFKVRVKRGGNALSKVRDEPAAGHPALVPGRTPDIQLDWIINLIYGRIFRIRYVGYPIVY